MKWIS